MNMSSAQHLTLIIKPPSCQIQCFNFYSAIDSFAFLLIIMMILTLIMNPIKELVLGFWAAAFCCIFQRRHKIMKFNPDSLDVTKVRTIVYHLPGGKRLRIDIGDINKLTELQFEIGSICDTSAIDGVLHFFQRGNA